MTQVEAAHFHMHDQNNNVISYSMQSVRISMGFDTTKHDEVVAKMFPRGAWQRTLAENLAATPISSGLRVDYGGYESMGK